MDALVLITRPPSVDNIQPPPHLPLTSTLLLQKIQNSEQSYAVMYLCPRFHSDSLLCPNKILNNNVLLYLTLITDSVLVFLPGWFPEKEKVVKLSQVASSSRSLKTSTIPAVPPAGSVQCAL